MGTDYFLIRRDVGTVYELNRAGFLERVFGHGVPTRVTESEIDTMVDLILAAERGDLDGRYDVTIHRGPGADSGEERALWRELASDVVDWSEGQPFELHSEHSGAYEELSMAEWDESPPMRRLIRTGGLGRQDLANMRRTNEAFRRGVLWSDPERGLLRTVSRSSSTASTAEPTKRSR